jgi:NAD(P)H-dependent flavin oxidoreductase YrpB (nitropropane dioxygenase family)
MTRAQHIASWRTRITELFGIRLPVLAGGLMWLSDARYVAAVVRAGAMGFMTPRSFAIEEFDRQLALCAELSGGRPFGVNLTLSSRAAANGCVPQQLDLALRAGVRHFETVGPSPRMLIERIHSEGGVVIHKCASVEHALKAEAAGADAIALVGMEAGGHPGMNPLPASMLCALALEQLDKPIALGGGIGTARQVAAALALGCEAVVVGTRLLACDEVPVHPQYRQRLIDSKAHDSVTVLRSTGNPWRVLDNATARAVAALEQGGATRYEEFGELALGVTGRDGAYRQGDADRGLLSMGPAIGFVDRCEPIAAAIASLTCDVAIHLRRTGSWLPNTQGEEA